MKAEMKTKWLAALRSGKYEQGSGRLRSIDGTHFCCLGVLADVAGATWGDDGVPSVYGKPNLPAVLDSGKCGLPDKVQDYLVTLNDIHRLDFCAIADVVEKHIPVTE